METTFCILPWIVYEGLILYTLDHVYEYNLLHILYMNILFGTFYMTYIFGV